MAPAKSINRCEVFWHGRPPGKPVHVGTLFRNGPHLYFAYDKDWLPLKLEISPGKMPLQLGIAPISLTDSRSQAFIQNLDLRNEFRGLPGPFYDSLPDRWGMKLIEIHTQKDAAELDPLEILCHRGNRCMGAFSYQPATTPDTPPGPVTGGDITLYSQYAVRRQLKLVADDN